MPKRKTIEHTAELPPGTVVRCYGVAALPNLRGRIVKGFAVYRVERDGKRYERPGYVVEIEGQEYFAAAGQVAPIDRDTCGHLVLIRERARAG